MDFRIWLCFVGAFVMIAAEESSERNQNHLTCVSSYLKSKGLLEKNFLLEFSASNSSDLLCEPFLSNFNESFYKKYEENMKTDKDLVDDAACIIEKLKEYQLLDLELIGIVNEYAKNKPKSMREKARKAIDHAIEKKTETAVKTCTVSRLFGSVFDVICKEVNESNSDEEEDPLSDYCIRKFLIDNSFINTSIYAVHLNPTNTNVSDVNCDDIVEQARHLALSQTKKRFEESFKFTSRCSRKSLQNSLYLSNYFESAAKAAVICEIETTPEQHEIERSSFVEVLNQVYETVLLCCLQR